MSICGFPSVFRLWLLLCLVVSSAFAQDTGGVSGVVVSTWDGAPLPGAVVTVRGTTLAAQTGDDGRYTLAGLPPGDQVLRFSKSGYASVTVTDVRVLPGQTTTVNGHLRPEFFEMEEYEVTAEEFTEETAQILVDRQESSGMVDGIGADFMSRVGAGDAAEALGKVAGASVADGKFAVIRGLADRYTSTTLNGLELPSADPDRKAAQLDLLPSQVIQRMDVAKTFSPDLAGGFAGGSINIVTRDYPEEFLFTMSVGVSYNTQATGNGDFLVSDQGGHDWLAMDDGKRALPDVAASTPPQGTSGPVQNEPLVKRSFGSTQLLPVQERAPMNSSFSMAVGDSVGSDHLRFGYLSSLSYKNDYKFYGDGYVRKYGGAGGTELVTDKVDARGVAEYSWSASTALTLSVGEDHAFKYNVLYVQAAEDEARLLTGQQENYTEPGTTYLDQALLHWTERNLLYNQLAGEHVFSGLNDIRFDWAGALSTATQEEPDYRISQFLIFEDGSGYQAVSPASPSFPTRYWRELEENNVSVRGDLTFPLPSYNEKENAFKTGLAYSDSERDYYQRGFVMFPLRTPVGAPEDYFDEINQGNVQIRNFPVNVTYQGRQNIVGAYAMGDWAALEWLRFTAGARVEQTDLSLSGFNQTLNQPLRPGAISQEDLLPSASVVVALRENVQLRAAWSQTVVRPTYREIAPVAIYDIANSRQIFGNPDLTFAESANYDLRLDWYPRPGEVASVSVFAKQIADPIELIAINAEDVSYLNSENADLFGVEAEFRTRLDHFWEPLEELTLGFNAAYITSEVPITDAQRASRNGSYLENGTSRPLYDQPEFILNADLTWDHAATGTALTVSGGVVGRRLVAFGLTTPDEYEEPAPQLDVFLTQKLGKNWKLKLSAKNLLDPAYQVSQTSPLAGHRIIKSYTRGMTFGLSVGCEF